MRIAIRALVVVLTLSATVVSLADIKVETRAGSGIIRDKSFAFVEGIPARSFDAQDRILAAVERELEARDFIRVFGEAGAHVVTHVLADRHSLADLDKGNYFEYWSGIDSVDASDLRAGTLVVDIVDAAETRTLWRGVASAPVKGSADKNLKMIDKIVKKLFSEFPVR